MKIYTIKMVKECMERRVVKREHGKRKYSKAEQKLYLVGKVRLKRRYGPTGNEEVPRALFELFCFGD